MVENVEYFRPKLDVEVLGDAPDVIVLEDRKVQFGQARADQDVTAGIAAQVKA